MPGKQLTMANGEVQDADPICHSCQQPGADVQALTGEWYHRDCLPTELVR